MKYFEVKVKSLDKSYKTTYLVETDNLLTPDEIHGLFSSTMLHQLSIDGKLDEMIEREEVIQTEDGDEIALPLKVDWKELSPEDYLITLTTEDSHIKEVFNLSNLGHVADSTISINRKFPSEVKGKTQYLSFTGVSSSGETFEDCKKITLQTNREKLIDKTYRDIVRNMRKYKRIPGLDIKRGFFVMSDISKDEYQEEINDSALNF